MRIPRKLLLDAPDAATAGRPLPRRGDVAVQVTFRYRTSHGQSNFFHRRDVAGGQLSKRSIRNRYGLHGTDHVTVGLTYDRLTRSAQATLTFGDRPADKLLCPRFLQGRHCYRPLCHLMHLNPDKEGGDEDPSDQEEEGDAEPGAESEWGADDLEWEQTGDGEDGEEGWGEETGGHTEQPVRPPVATLSASHQRPAAKASPPTMRRAPGPDRPAAEGGGKRAKAEGGGRHQPKAPPKRPPKPQPQPKAKAKAKAKEPTASFWGDGAAPPRGGWKGKEALHMPRRG